MKDARVSATQLSKKACGKVFEDLMSFLAWSIWDTFNRSFDKVISEMFPNYSDAWSRKYNEISALSQVNI